MKIGILSDLHGYPEKYKKALVAIGECNMLLCAGDILYHGPRNPILEGYNPTLLAEEILKNETPMLIANGNCDAAVDYMLLKLPISLTVIVYEIHGIRFMVMHGHDVDDKELMEIAKLYKVNIMITGHTHIRKFEKNQDFIFINPGSISIPKGDGQPSVAVYEDGEIKFINIETNTIIEKFRV